MPYFKQKKPPVCFNQINQPLVDKLYYEGRALYCAAAIIAKDPKIRTWLSKNDPKALKQIDEAIDE